LIEPKILSILLNFDDLLLYCPDDDHNIWQLISFITFYQIKFTN